MAAFAWFRRHVGMGSLPDAYRDLVVNVDQVVMVGPSTGGHSVLTLNSQEYTVEVEGKLEDTVETLRRAVRQDGLVHALSSISSSVNILAEQASS
jgi:hypothetical protein